MLDPDIYNPVRTSGIRLTLDGVGDDVLESMPPLIRIEDSPWISAAGEHVAPCESDLTVTVLPQREALRATVDVNGVAVTGRARNLSISGLFFAANLRLTFGTQVTISIAFPKPCGIVQFPAIVRWADRDGIGLQFGLLGARQTFAIVTEIAKRQRTSPLRACY